MRDGKDLLTDFYTAKQLKVETVAAWNCQLKGTWAKALEQGKIARGDEAKVLHCRFWNALVQLLRDRSSHKRDSFGDFDKLR